MYNVITYTRTPSVILKVCLASSYCTKNVQVVTSQLHPHTLDVLRLLKGQQKPNFKQVNPHLIQL